MNYLGKACGLFGKSVKDANMNFEGYFFGDHQGYNRGFLRIHLEGNQGYR